MGRGLSEWTGPSVRRKRLCLFRREELRPHARTRCPPEAANSHTVRPRSVFPDAQVAGENGFHFLRACGRELCEAFSTGPCFFFRFLLPRCDAAAPPWVFVLAPVHPRGSRRLSAFVTLRLFPTRGFLPPRTKPIRACRPPCAFVLAPVHPRGSRRLSAHLWYSNSRLYRHTTSPSSTPSSSSCWYTPASRSLRSNQFRLS